MKKILLILLICIYTFLLCATENDIEVVILKQTSLFRKMSSGSEKAFPANVGEKFSFLQEKGNWLEVQYHKQNYWIPKNTAALSNDMNYAGKVVVKRNYVHLASKMGGKDNKIVKELMKGDIATIINAEKSYLSNYQVQLADGTTGWLKGQFITRIGPMTEEEKSKHGFHERFLRKEGQVYNILKSIDDWGNTGNTAKIIVWIISIIFFFLPMFLLSKYVNLICSVKFIPTWLVKFTLVIFGLYSMKYMMPIYIGAPFYENLYLGILFEVIFIFWIGREFKKIKYHRCPKCHSMWATANKGSIFLGGWKTTTTKKYSDGSKEVSTSTTRNYRDDRECLVCGHRWSIRRVKTT